MKARVLLFVGGLAPRNTFAFILAAISATMLIASFKVAAQSATYTLTVSKTGNGYGTVTSSPAGINCGSTCLADYSANTAVTLTAATSGSSSFTGWSGACTGTGACNITMSANKSVTANFSLNCSATCFVEPYASDGSQPPSPTSAEVAVTTPLHNVDIGFVVDTTFSMNGEVGALKSSLGTIFDTLSTRVPGLGVGIAGHDDVPTGKIFTCGNFGSCPAGFTCSSDGYCHPNANDYGSCDNTVPIYPSGLAASDDPYYQLTPVTTDKAATTNAVNNLHQGNGDDLPEGQLLALNYAVTGNTFSWPALNQCPAGSRSAVADTSTNFGALGFRKNALPLVMEISDAEFHNGVPVAGSSSIPPTTSSCCFYNPGSATCSAFTYTPQETYAMTEPSISDLATAMKTRGVYFLGGSADDSRAVRCGTTTYVSGPSSGVTGTSAARNPNYELSAYGDMAYLTDQTGALVPPSAFAHSASCPDGQCCTGFNGAGVTPDGTNGTCRLVFNVNHNGNGLGQQIIDSVNALLNTLKFDIYVQAYNDASETTDVVGNFMLKVEPDPNGGTDPVSGDVCVSFPAGQLADNFIGPKAVVSGQDGVNDTITQVNPSPTYCFKVTPKPNSVIAPATTEQIFHAWLKVLAINPAGGTLPLGPDREVRFIVPPKPNIVSPNTVVSRKTHGSAGAFDVNLPLTGAVGIECRSGDATNDHQLVFAFPAAVAVNGNPQAQVTTGTGLVGSAGVSNGGAVTVGGNTVTVPLTSVANAQRIAVTLFGVSDGSSTNDVIIPMNVLAGDTTGNGAVNSSDIALTQSKSGQVVDSTNFREDVTVNGSINSSDIAFVQSKSGTGVPSTVPNAAQTTRDPARKTIPRTQRDLNR